MSANVWQPGNEVINVDAESTNLSQVFIATENQVDFILTDFSYTPNTGSISVHRNGQKLIKGTDYTEATTSKVTLTGISLAAGEVIEVNGIIGSTGANVILAEAAALLASTKAGEAALSANEAAASALAAASIIPDQTGQAGKFLGTDGTNPAWQAVDALPSQTGHAGKVLGTDGTSASWQAQSANKTTLGMFENAAVISANYTIETGNNAISAGPIVIADGVLVTVPDGSTWSIV